MSLQHAFGKAVRDRRTALQLTQDELAERAGLTGKYIGTVERGERDPGLFSMQVLAKALGTVLGDLMGGAPIALSDRALEAAKEFDHVDAFMQEAILEILRATQANPKTNTAGAALQAPESPRRPAKNEKKNSPRKHARAAGRRKTTPRNTKR